MEKIANLRALFITTKNLNEADNKRIALTDKNDTVKIDINTLFDIDMEVMLSHLNYAENAYAKYFHKSSKYINHLVKDEKILKKNHLKIWNKIKSLIKKDLNSEPVYNDQYIEN